MFRDCDVTSCVVRLCLCIFCNLSAGYVVTSSFCDLTNFACSQKIETPHYIKNIYLFAKNSTRKLDAQERC